MSKKQNTYGLFQRAYADNNNEPIKTFITTKEPEGGAEFQCVAPTDEGDNVVTEIRASHTREGYVVSGLGKTTFQQLAVGLFHKARKMLEADDDLNFDLFQTMWKLVEVNRNYWAAKELQAELGNTESLELINSNLGRIVTMAHILFYTTKPLKDEAVKKFTDTEWFKKSQEALYKVD